jgi:hypothetical protein
MGGIVWRPSWVVRLLCVLVFFAEAGVWASEICVFKRQKKPFRRGGLGFHGGELFGVEFS